MDSPPRLCNPPAVAPTGTGALRRLLPLEAAWCWHQFDTVTRTYSCDPPSVLAGGLPAVDTAVGGTFVRGTTKLSSCRGNWCPWWLFVGNEKRINIHYNAADHESSLVCCKILQHHQVKAKLGIGNKSGNWYGKLMIHARINNRLHKHWKQSKVIGWVWLS